MSGASGAADDEKKVNAPPVASTKKAASLVQIEVEWLEPSTDPACQWPTRWYEMHTYDLACTTPRTVQQMVPVKFRTRTCTIWRIMSDRDVDVTGTIVDLTSANANRPLAHFVVDDAVRVIVEFSDDS